MFAWLVALAALGGALWLLWRAAHLPTRWLNAGRLDFRRHVYVNGRCYYIEQVAFADYQQALTQYIRLLNQLETRASLREFQSDYLDWTSALLRFDGYCIHLVRCIDKIRLIKSEHAMSLAEFEQDLTALAEAVGK